MAKNTTDRGMSKLIYLAVAVAAGLLTLAIAPLTGLQETGQRLLGTLVFIVIVWVTEAVPYPVSSLMLIVLMTWAGAGPKVTLKASFQNALTGFSATVPIAVMVATAFAAVVKSVGLSERIIYKIMAACAGRKGTAKASSILGSMFFAEIPLTFLVPTATGRTALYLSFVEGLIKPYGFGKIEEKGEINPFQKAAYMATAIMPVIMGAAFLTGAEATLLAGRLIEEGTHVAQYWTESIKYLLLPALLMLAVTFFIMVKQFPSSIDNIPLDFIHTQLEKMGPMKREEKYVLITLLIAVTLWITDKLHHIPAEAILVLVAVILFLPRIGPGDWKRDSKSIAWGAVLVIAASTGFASMLAKGGVIKMIVGWLSHAGVHSFIGVMALMAASTLLLRLGVASITAAAALFVPLAIAMGQEAGFSPGQLVALGWITYVFCRAGYFLPQQSGSMIMAYEYGYFSRGDVFKLGIWLTVATIIIYGIWASVAIPTMI
ncbi:SLC13 family permease [Anaerospora hongkongensis]|uniref:SLC13 family permease n=1 Tax=Anaerospora hongkongensis TaxID=244830 RepID=UPI00289FAF8A|nr:SLC13 family permease [Anaerospora hongkongensis]